MKLSIAGLLALWGFVLSQLAVGQTVTVFPVPVPLHIVSGPDGNLWITTEGPALMRMTTGGLLTRAASVDAFDLAFDAAGNLWLTEDYKIGRLAPDGTLTEFIPPGDGRSPLGRIAVGSDGDVWFTVLFPTAIGRLSSSGLFSVYPLSTTPIALAAGPDGNLWFTRNGDWIGRISPSGITEFSVQGPGSITSGSDGALWFTKAGHRIGRISTSGVVSVFDTPGFEEQSLVGITYGSDGAIWFTGTSPIINLPNPPVSLVPGKIGRMTRNGEVTAVVLPPSLKYVEDITTGSDGNLWVTALFGSAIGRIVPAPTSCSDDAKAVCLANGRFRLTATWQSPDTAGIGTGMAVTSNTGAFWFFDPTNLELVVKVLDGRPINGKWWLFYGSLTNVEFTLTVTDTQTGAIKIYTNPQGQLASVADTSAF